MKCITHKSLLAEEEEGNCDGCLRLLFSGVIFTLRAGIIMPEAQDIVTLGGRNLFG